MGSLGNKGSCLVRFDINDSKIAIACNHLSAGQELYEGRRMEITDILNTSFKIYPSMKEKSSSTINRFRSLMKTYSENNDDKYLKYIWIYFWYLLSNI